MYVWGASRHYPNIQGMSKHRGHSNIQGAIHIYGGIQLYGASKCMGHMDTPYCDKACFFVLCMYRGHPNIFQTYGTSKHMGCPHIFRGHPNIGVPHIFGFPLYIHNTKKACFVRLRGCPYAPYIWMPHIFECPLYVGMPHMF